MSKNNYVDGFKVKCPYDEYKKDFVPEPGMVFDPTDSVVQHAHAAECDINNIMKRYERDGVLDHVVQHPGYYGDFTDVPDYASSLQIVIEAEEMFMSLPAQVRKRFANNPQEFLDFVSDPANREEMAKMGLLEPVREVGIPLGQALEERAEEAPKGAPETSTS